MFYSAEQEKRILAEQEIMRPGKPTGVSLCQYKNLSCVRCCLPHIGGDSPLEDSGEKRIALFNKCEFACRYLGPGNIVMKFKNFNPVMGPGIGASQYEDSFQDVGREEMERRFSNRRALFLEIYNREQPRQSLYQYMKAAQLQEGYRYVPEASAGPISMFLGGSVPTKNLQRGELPECHLLGFLDPGGTVGCMAHPMAETSGGYDGRDQVGFFHHTGCCGNIGCEASKEFQFLSPSARKIFDKAVQGMSWYQYSRHATSVLVYYLRSYDFVLEKLDKRMLLDALTLERLVDFTNALYDKWPMRRPEKNSLRPMDSLAILSMDIPLTERMTYIALDTWFLQDPFAIQLQQTRDYIEKCIEALRGG